MRVILLALLPLQALADSLCWLPVTTDTNGRTLPNAVTYQIYQNGVAYGLRLARAAIAGKAPDTPKPDGAVPRPDAAR